VSNLSADASFSYPFIAVPAIHIILYKGDISARAYSITEG